MTVLVKDMSQDDAIKGIALRFGSTEEWARALVATFVEFGLLKFEKPFSSFREIKVNLPFERLPQHAGDSGFGPVPNVVPLGSNDPNHPSNIAEIKDGV